MTIITTIKTVKRQYPEQVVLVKVGEFYNVYGMDACILSYLLDYKLRITDKVCYTCGFPAKSISKIKEQLKENNISYVLMNSSMDIEETSFNEENKYEEVSKKAYSYIKVKEKIENINKYFLMNINQVETLALISQIEEIINGYQNVTHDINFEV